MSTIVGFIDNDRILMGCDSRASTSDGQVRPVVCEKVFVNGDYLIGFIGSIRCGQILDARYFTPPDDIYNMPEAIRKHLNDFGCLGVDRDDQTCTTDSNYLIAKKDSGLFEILTDFQMNKISQYAALGSGNPYAYASLYTTGEIGGISAIERIEYALNAANMFDGATAPPFKIHTI